MTSISSRLAITIVALTLSAMLATSTLAGSGFKPITTESEFNQLVVGKKMNFNQNFFTIKKNGSLRGNFGGKALKGNWAWREGYWCRTLVTHSKNTDCQLWEVEGNQFRVTRERGNGKSFIYVAN